MIDPRVMTFLSVLKDGRWHQKFPPQVIAKVSHYVIDACFDFRLVERKLVRVRGDKRRTSVGHFRITDRGQRVLNRAKAPTREDVQLTRRVLVFKGRVFSGTALDMALWRGLQRRLNVR